MPRPAVVRLASALTECRHNPKDTSELPRNEHQTPDPCPAEKLLRLGQLAISIAVLGSTLSHRQNNLDDNGELVHQMYQKN
jgi:hypothetical protein